MKLPQMSGATQPNSQLTEMIKKLKSRKLWVAAIAAFIASVGTGIGLSEESVQKIIEIAMVYIGGQGIVDAAGAYKGGANGES